MYLTLTLPVVTNSWSPTVFHSSSGHRTVSREEMSARILFSFRPFQRLIFASTISLAANFSSSSFSASASAARMDATRAELLISSVVLEDRKEKKSSEKSINMHVI